LEMMERGEFESHVGEKKVGALIRYDIEQGLDEDRSRSAMGFSAEEEEKLVFNYIGRIYGDLGEYGRAIKYFKKKLSLTPSNLPVEGNVPVLLERAIIENQIGTYLYLSGNLNESIAFFRKSLKGSIRIRNNFGTAVNAENIGRICAEILLTGKYPEGTTMQSATDQLGRVCKILTGEQEYINNGTLINLKNLIGILFFARSQGWSAEGPTMKENNKTEALKASLRKLEKDYSSLKLAQEAFREGLDLIDRIPRGAARFNTSTARAVLANKRVRNPNSNSGSGSLP